MAALNERFLGKEGPTDVLSFPIEDEVGPERALARRGRHRARVRSSRTPTGCVLLGDVVICPAVAARNAVDHGVTFDDEIALLVVHGILHLARHGPRGRGRGRADGAARAAAAGSLLPDRPRDGA